MKILIWFICIFVNSLITVLLKYAGFMLGGIPTAIFAGLTIWLACVLCKKWDKHRSRRVSAKAIERDKKTKFDIFLLITSIASIVLTIPTFFCIVAAMILQDPRRLIKEDCNPNIFYCILVVLLLSQFVFSIMLLTKKQTVKMQPWVAIFATVVAVVACVEGSVFSDGVSKGCVYDYFDVIDSLNWGWILGIVISLLIWLPWLFIGTKNMTASINQKWYNSITYRERCYAKVDKMHSYYEKGIISQEEYEKLKEKYLKNIQNISD